jgi:hypothetical protein
VAVGKAAGVAIAGQRFDENVAFGVIVAVCCSMACSC